MFERAITAPDLQAVFRFFGKPALAYFQSNNVVPPACVLTWLAEASASVERLHQFPTDLVVKLMQSAEGRGQLASAISAMFNPDAPAGLMPPGPMPHLVVQVMLTSTRVGGVDVEVLLMLAHERGLTHTAAVVVNEGKAPVLPEMFDITSTPVDGVEPDTEVDAYTSKR